MRDVSRANPGIRRFPEQTSPIIYRGGRRSVAGTPHRSFDVHAGIVIWAGGLLAFVMLLMVNGGAAIVWLFAGGPVSMGLAWMFGRMGETRGWQQVVAVVYFLLVVLVLAFILLKEAQPAKEREIVVPHHLRIPKVEQAF